MLLDRSDLKKMLNIFNSFIDFKIGSIRNWNIQSSKIYSNQCCQNIRRKIYARQLTAVKDNVESLLQREYLMYVHVQRILN